MLKKSRIVVNGTSKIRQPTCNWIKRYSMNQLEQLIRASGRSRKKKANFAAFSGTNPRKKGQFRGNFAGISQASLAEKRFVKNSRFRGSFPRKFRWKAISFALIWGTFSKKLHVLIAFTQASHRNMKSYCTSKLMKYNKNK